MRKIITLNGNAIPSLLTGLKQPPKQLFVEGDLSAILEHPRVAVVGSRKVTAYGQAVTKQLASDLARQGIVIVSGLAYGVDGIAHKAALDAGGLTAAVLPTSLERVHPSLHRQLAQQIVAQGGALISEYPPSHTTQKGDFVARNRLVTGISDALLITEATEGSGTLHTARYAKQQGKPLLVVPGNITSLSSAGTNWLIQRGATLVRSTEDVLNVLGMRKKSRSKIRPVSQNPHEQAILDSLFEGTSDGYELLEHSGLDAAQFGQTLTMLEIQGAIQPLGNNKWMLVK